MKAKKWIPLVLAIVLGGAAAKLTRDSMAFRHKGDARETTLVLTVTAARELAAGQLLTAADLATSRVAPEAVQTGSFQAADELLGRVALSRIVKGQAVLESLLAPAGTAAGVQALIPRGMRAITVQVTEFSGLAGLLAPGCRVDMISLIRNDAGEGSVARTVIQNVEVRAIGTQISATTHGAGAGEQGGAAAAAGGGAPAFVNNVTLLVTPEQAEAVQLASMSGNPWLVLRNTNDTEPVETEGVSLADLRGRKRLKVEPEDLLKPVAVVDPFAGKTKADEPAPQTRPVTRTVRIIRATREESLEVEVAPNRAGKPAAAPLAGPPPTALTNTDTTGAAGE